MRKIQIILIAILCAVLMTACASAEDLLIEANTAFEQGQWQIAIEAGEKLLKKAETADQSDRAKEIIDQSTAKMKWSELQKYVAENHDTIELNADLDVEINNDNIRVEYNNIVADEDQGVTICTNDFTVFTYTLGQEEASVEFRRYEGYLQGRTKILGLEDKIIGSIKVKNYSHDGEMIVESYDGDNLILFTKGRNACESMGQQRMHTLLETFETRCLEPVGMTLEMIGFKAY